MQSQTVYGVASYWLHHDGTQDAHVVSHHAVDSEAEAERLHRIVCTDAIADVGSFAERSIASHAMTFPRPVTLQVTPPVSAVIRAVFPD